MSIEVHFLPEKFARLEQNCYLCTVVNNKGGCVPPFIKTYKFHEDESQYNF